MRPGILGIRAVVGFGGGEVLQFVGELQIAGNPFGEVVGAYKTKAFRDSATICGWAIQQCLEDSDQARVVLCRCDSGPPQIGFADFFRGHLEVMKEMAGRYAAGAAKLME